MTLTITDLNLCNKPLHKLESACTAGSLLGRELRLAQVMIADLGNALAHALLAVVGAPLCVLIGCDVRQVLIASKTHATISLCSAAAFCASIPAIAQPSLALRSHNYLNLFKRPEAQKSWMQRQSLKIQNILANKKVLAALFVTSVVVGVVAFKYCAQPLPPPLPEDRQIKDLLKTVEGGSIGWPHAAAFAYASLTFFCPKIMDTVHGALWKGTVFCFTACKAVLSPLTSLVSFLALPVLRRVGICLSVLGRVLNSIAFTVAKVCQTLLKSLVRILKIGIRPLTFVLSHIASAGAKLVKPIAASMLGLAKVTGAFVKDQIWPVTRLVLERLGGALGSLCRGLLNVTATVLGETAAFFKYNIGPVVRSLLANLGELLSSLGNFLGERVHELLGAIRPVARLVLERLGGALGSLCRGLLNVTAKVLGETSAFLRYNIGPVVRSLLASLGELLSSFMNVLKGRVRDLLGMANFFFGNTILPTVQSLLEKMSLLSLTYFKDAGFFIFKSGLKISYGCLMNIGIPIASLVWQIAKPILKGISKFNISLTISGLKFLCITTPLYGGTLCLKGCRALLPQWARARLPVFLA